MSTTSFLPHLILSLLLSLFLSGCGGGDPTEGDPGAQGATGKNALMTVSAEPAGGGHCAVSGSKIDAGPDVNANGLLDANEVSSTQYLCSGTAGGGGANALVQMLDEPSGANCAAGGKAINVGLDGNANGVLDANEVSSSGHVCNGSGGTNGVNGANGTNGSNGLSTLISIASEPAGANCAYGGIKISSAATTNYSCNGAPSADLTWVIVDDANSPKQALRNTNYIATGDAQVVLTLPAEGNIDIGDVVRINGAGPGGWRIAQNDRQAVHTKNLGGMAGAIWSAHDPQRNWQSVASSADGSKLVAIDDSGIYTSTDGGWSWTAQLGAPALQWVSIASSADGNKLVAAASNDRLYTSIDGGVSWGTGSGVNQAPIALWRSVASSADGSKLVAAIAGSGGEIYTSNNSGATWVASNGSNAAPGANWQSVASSADGSKLVAVAAVPGRAIYTSTDSGATWGYSNLPPQDWTSVATSADGSKLVAGGFATGLYTSTDGGVSWTTSSGPNQSPTAAWITIVSSADGTKLAAVSINGGKIYTSSDSGANWTARDSGRGWSSVASSADGTRLTAAVYGGQIYTSTATTTLGTSGSISGGASDAIELQYVGNGMFTVLSHSGSLTIQ